MEVWWPDISHQTARAVAVRQAEDVTGGGSGDDKDSLELGNLKRALETSQKEAEAAKKEVLALKRRSESIARDYDRFIQIITGTIHYITNITYLTYLPLG